MSKKKSIIFYGNNSHLIFFIHLVIGIEVLYINSTIKRFGGIDQNDSSIWKHEKNLRKM